MLGIILFRPRNNNNNKKKKELSCAPRQHDVPAPARGLGCCVSSSCLQCRRGPTVVICIMHSAAALSVIHLFIIIIVTQQQQRFRISYLFLCPLTPFARRSATRRRTQSITSGTLTSRLPTIWTGPTVRTVVSRRCSASCFLLRLICYWTKCHRQYR